MLQTEQILHRRYTLLQQLGNNAGRQTWLAADTATSPAETVIVKLLAFNPQMQWDELKLFEREAAVLKQLSHPRIPRYRDYFSLDREEGEGLCWFGLVQDYIPGDSLQALLDAGRHFTETQVRSIAKQALEILIYLHGLNPPTIHRDIKPSNIILSADEKVYLVDFGAVQDTAVAAGATFTVVGTTGYAPLEQFWGKAVPASDLYALGATLIHLLTGTSPADLPARDLRIQWSDRVSVNPNFVSWIEALTEPDLVLRMEAASQALQALHKPRFISRPMPASQPPLLRDDRRHKNAIDNFLKLIWLGFLAIGIVVVGLLILAIIFLTFIVFLMALETHNYVILIICLIADVLLIGMWVFGFREYLRAASRPQKFQKK